MTTRYSEEYRDPALAKGLIDKLRRSCTKPIQLMEVCGTHTVSIFRSGVRSVLPESLGLLSGPGCPVCVTAQGEIDGFVDLAGEKETIITTFGDLMRVPGTASSLQKERASGRDIRMVYSTFDALDIARENPKQQVVFLGVGFETTAPTIAAAIVSAKQMNLENFSVYCAHKLVPPALEALMELDDVRVDGFILPGHVSVIIGEDGYAPFFNRHRVPCVITGFEPADILQGVSMLVEQIETGKPQLANAYKRAVTKEGNTKARALLDEVFEPADTVWRGIGVIPQSGLVIRPDFSSFDAMVKFDITPVEAPEPKGCACGEILTGTKLPPECALYKKACTPVDPVGPCMVSSEGTCAAYYRYHG